MKYRVTHRTEYLYSGNVSQCHNLAHLRPRDSERQQCLQHQLHIDPAPNDVAEHTDFFGNRMSYFSIQRPHQSMTVTASSEVILNEAAGQLPLYNDAPWDTVRDALAVPQSAQLGEQRQYTLDSPLAAAAGELADYAKASFPAGRPLLEAVHDLMQRVHKDFAYDPGFTTISTPLSEVLANRRGVCQDFA
ncbi:MAG: transglutaminase N-terminal domain-containing protein, partial [Gammaproteobacteria bacterium]